MISRQASAKNSLLLTLLLGAATLPGAAQAQPYGRGNLGGGFIEMLMTGRDPSPRAAAPIPTPGAPLGVPPAQWPAPQPMTAPRYASLPQGGPPEPMGRIERGFAPRFERQVVEYDGPHAAGTIVIDSPNKFLYLVQGGGKALRYGIGVGRPGFTWAGVKTITRKAEWPGWTPPPEMLKRRPDLPAHMEGGPDNPLGARAMYLGSTLYRIHGTNEPNTIGQNVSSGCIRLRNEDVEDLYSRVRVGTKVIVI
ncbi:L,D-transpeptidase [Alsobacter sp. KACC 23698]|uniref:L,D-transpeptidase n=1 Tax=Alsobacter sp. KACC 23698 TaxID=3149229 RepID=A0AAU7JH79_9HYPH